MECETPSADKAATPPEPPADQPIEGGAAYCRQILANLLAISNEMAEILAHQIRCQVDDPEAARKTVAAFTPLAQSIRRSIMLQEKLARPQKPQRERVVARKKIIRDVEDAIEANAAPGEQETLQAELLERLDSPYMEQDIADRPIGEIVADINRDLGITGRDDGHAGKRRTAHDIAILNARAAQVPGAAPSETLLALLAAAPPKPVAPPPEDYSKLDMRTLMMRTGRLREPWGG